MLKCINQLTGRSSWQQGKWFQEIASFLKGQKSGSPKLLNLFYHVTSIKTVLAATFLNLKTSTVWRSLNIQASDAGMESKRTEINWQHPESILLQHLTKLPKTGLVVVIMLITERTMVLHPMNWVPCSPWFLLVVFLVFFFSFMEERKENKMCICWSSLQEKHPQRQAAQRKDAMWIGWISSEQEPYPQPVSIQLPDDWQTLPRADTWHMLGTAGQEPEPE